MPLILVRVLRLKQNENEAERILHLFALFIYLPNRIPSLKQNSYPAVFLLAGFHRLMDLHPDRAMIYVGSKALWRDALPDANTLSHVLRHAGMRWINSYPQRLGCAFICIIYLFIKS